MTDPLVLAAVVWLLVLGAVEFGASFDPQRRSRAVGALVDRVDLPLDQRRADALEARLAVRARAGALGAAVGAVGAVPLLPHTVVPEVVLWWLVLPACAAAGRAGAVTAVSVREALRAAPPPGPRVARVPTPGVLDRVPRGARRGALLGAFAPAVLIAAVGAGAGGAGYGVAGAPPDPRVLAASAAVPVLLLVGAGLLGRRLLGAPQVAGSAEELAWDDVLRAEATTDLLAVPLVLGGAATVLVLREAAVPVGSAVGLGAVGVLLLAVVLAAAAPPRRVVRRLWPHGARVPAGDRR